MFAHDLGVKRQRRLRHRRHTEGLSRQHEACDIAAAVDRAVNSKRLVGMDDRDMRCAKEVEILQRLFGVSCLVSPDDAERVVELETAFAPPLQIHAAIFAGKWKIAGVRFAAGGGGVNHVAEFPGGGTGGDRELPWLAVAPRCGLLRGHQDALDGGARYRIGPEGAARKTLAQQFFQHTDALFDAVAAGRRVLEGIGHVHLPLVGILLNGTSLSTRMSPGSPSTRSAMMLRMISSVPPSTRVPGARSSMAWNLPAPSASSAPLRTPAAPCRSSAYITTS